MALGGAALCAEAVAAADPAPSSDPIAARMRALAVEKRDALQKIYPELAPANDEWLPALGPCKRPDDAQRAVIRATIDAWIAGQLNVGKDTQLMIGQVRAGCDEAAGIVVDVQADMLPEHNHQGHWWILRIKDRAVDVLGHHRGTATEDYMEWADETQLFTVGLADLDRDGTLDVIAGLSSHEGGAFDHHTMLSSILSRTHRTVKIAEFDDSASLARGQRHRPGDPVVVSIHERRRGGAPERVFYRCLDTRPELFRCSATRRAKQLDAAWEAVSAWTGNGTSSPLDSDLVAEQLAALDAPADEQAQILAQVLETSPGLRLARRLARFTYPDDDRTDTERAAAELADAQAASARLSEALGARPCSLSEAARARAAQDRLRAWGKGHAPTGDTTCTPSSGCVPATRFEILGGCTAARGSYYELAWKPSSGSYGVHRHALVFAAGNAVTPLRDFAAVGDDSPPPAAGDSLDPGFSVMFSRQGDAAAAIVLDKGATAVIDGAVVGSLPGDLAFYAVHFRVASNVVVVSHDSNADEYWRIGRAGFEHLGSLPWGFAPPLPDKAPPRILVDLELVNRARDHLRSVDWTSPEAPDKLREAYVRDNLVPALTILKADRSLIAAVKAQP